MSRSTGTPGGELPQASFRIASLNELAARATALDFGGSSLSDGVLNFFHLLNLTGIVPAADHNEPNSREQAKHIKSILESPRLSVDNESLIEMSRAFGGCNVGIEGSASPREAIRKIVIAPTSRHSPVVPGIEIRATSGGDVSVIVKLDSNCKPDSHYSRTKQDLLAKLGVNDLSQLEYFRFLGVIVLKTSEVPAVLLANSLRIAYQEAPEGL